MLANFTMERWMVMVGKLRVMEITIVECGKMVFSMDKARNTVQEQVNSHQKNGEVVKDGPGDI